MTRTIAITGALSFTGRYISSHILSSSSSSSSSSHLLDTTTTNIINLSSRTTPLSTHNLPPSSSHPSSSSRITNHELCFHDPLRLTRALEGVDVLYATYWIRFAGSSITSSSSSSGQDDNHAKAADRCRVLFDCAKMAGVKKVVFSAHTGLDENSRFGYIAGKARAVRHLVEISSSSSMNYAIVKPCGIFGDLPSESILFNNAAYVMRRSPLFLLPGAARHAHFQPIHVRDMAELMISLGCESVDTTGECLDAVGRDAPTARELFEALGEACGARWCRVVESPLSTRMVTAMTKPLDWMTGDVLLDDDDLDLMCEGLTVADDPSDERIGKRMGVMDWFKEKGEELGREYVSSVERYYYKR